MTYSPVVHGGAGTWKGASRKKAMSGVRRAASQGQRLLQRGRAAIDAVEACVVVVEDDPVFNAGCGSALNLSGRVEMDASIMDGRTLQAGAVAMIARVKNPIRLARLVMEKTDHVLIAGSGAEHLAKVFHLQTTNPVTPHARRSWRLLRAQLALGRLDPLTRTSKLVHEFPKPLFPGTVGAVARDNNGNIAAATSTGDLALKLSGRVGDTPLLGCGAYADRSGGCSVAGIGEGAIRLVLAKTACDFMSNGLGIQRAVRKSVKLLWTRLGMRIGMIAVDARGRVGVAHSTRDLCWAVAISGMRGPRAAIKWRPCLPWIGEKP